MKDYFWPKDWPTPDECFKGLPQRISSIYTMDLLLGIQIIMRFENGYGAHIINARLQDGLTEISAIKFDGPGINDYIFLFDDSVPDLTWCYSVEEVFRLCGKISQLPEAS